MRSVRSCALVGALTLLLSLVVQPHVAATYPGTNGPIVWGRSNEIWKMNGDGSNPVQLTNNGVGDVRPSISPDRTKVVFMSFRQPDGSSGNTEIYVMDADGGNQTPLTECSDAMGQCQNFESEPTWSPDGLRIAWSHQVIQPDIWTMDPDGQNAFNVTNTVGGYESTPEWSPDGSKIAFTVSGNHDDNAMTPSLSTNQIGIIDADGTDPLLFTNDGNQNIQPTWSPDGTKIAWVVADTGKIWTMDAADGANKAQLTTTGSYYSPVYSPDGTRIASQSGDDIETVDAANGTFANDLTNSSGVEDSYPSWAPGGAAPPDPVASTLTIGPAYTLTLDIEGELLPAIAGKTITVELYKRKRNRRWKLIGTMTPTTAADGSYSASFPSTGGKCRAQASFAGDGELLASSAGPLKFPCSP